MTRFRTLSMVVFLFTMLIAIKAQSESNQNPNSSRDQVVPLRSTRGREYLKQAHIDKYIDISTHFVTQENLAYCGVASGVIVLNAAGVDAPRIFQRSEFQLWTQDNFWTESARKVVSDDAVRRGGMTLDTLGRLLSAHGLKADVRHSNHLRLDDFRSLVSKGVDEAGCFVLVNYYRPVLGQKGGGHISPVAAYNPTADMLLIMDVARYRYEPVWVPTTKLYEATARSDTASAESRGVILLRRP